MSPAGRRYQQLQATLERVRAEHGGAESAQEDVLLERMDALWAQLTPEDIAELEATATGGGSLGRLPPKE